MIAIGSDHAGFTTKTSIIALLRDLGETVDDVGTTDTTSTDYPDWAHAVSTRVADGKAERGILVCGTGIGMAITANKHSGIRAAACESVTAARLARQHNDANVLCLGERLVGAEVAADIVRTFLATPFDGGERHRRRVEKIHSLTKR